MTIYKFLWIHPIAALLLFGSVCSATASYTGVGKGLILPDQVAAEEHKNPNGSTSWKLVTTNNNNWLMDFAERTGAEKAVAFIQEHQLNEFYSYGLRFLFLVDGQAPQSSFGPGMDKLQLFDPNGVQITKSGRQYILMPYKDIYFYSMADAKAFLQKAVEIGINRYGVLGPGTAIPGWQNLYFLRDDSVDLLGWLEDHPKIRSAIKWLQLQPSVEYLPFDKWSEAQKEDLVYLFKMIESGASEVIPELPQTQLEIDGMGKVEAMRYKQSEAWSTYLAYVAMSLHTEIHEQVPWTIKGYSETLLDYLFNSRYLFSGVAQGGEYYYRITAMEAAIRGAQSVTPGDPVRTFQFLKDHGLLGPYPGTTGLNLLEWSRDNLSHYVGSNTPENLEAHWQYAGFAPVERILEGTLSAKDEQQTVKHWTQGCWGTAGFLMVVLRTANVVYGYEVRGPSDEKHALPYDVLNSIYLSHGDDPYNVLARSTPRRDMSSYWLTKAEFLERFGPDWSNSAGIPDQELRRAIGKKPYEVAAMSPPDFLVDLYCKDQFQGLSKEEGSVYKFLSDKLTMAEMEEKYLWNKLQKRVNEIGGCGK